MNRILVVLTVLFSWAPALRVSAQQPPEAVSFQSLDGQTQLVGFLFAPRRPRPGGAPAVVMMHGRAGPYSTAANGVYDATTLSRRHMFWGEYWADQGYVALLVDSFGPRGFSQGFPAHSYESRPDAVSEVAVRPLDAYAALLYLRSRTDIDPRRIALQGWSNGGSATIASLSDAVFSSTKIAKAGLGPQNGFVGGLAFYPACGLRDRFAQGYKPYASLRLLSGDSDEEVSIERCAALVEASAALGGDVTIKVYPGATHGFDDPNSKRQKVDANAEATEDAVPRARDLIRGFFASVNSSKGETSGAGAAPPDRLPHRDSRDH